MLFFKGGGRCLTGLAPRKGGDSKPARHYFTQIFFRHQGHFSIKISLAGVRYVLKRWTSGKSCIIIKP
jgi:hypothetical protein